MHDLLNFAVRQLGRPRASSRHLHDVLMILAFSYLLLQCALQQCSCQSIRKRKLGLSDQNVDSHIFDKPSSQRQVILELHVLEVLRECLLVNSGKRLADLNPHVLRGEGAEGKIEEGAKRGIDVECVHVLIVFGTSIEGE